MGCSSTFLVSGVVFVQHLFNCDGTSDVLALCIRNLHDQQVEHHVCCRDAALGHLRHKPRTGYGIRNCDCLHRPPRKIPKDSLCLLSPSEQPTTHLMKLQEVLSRCLLHPGSDFGQQEHTKLLQAVYTLCS